MEFLKKFILTEIILVIVAATIYFLLGNFLLEICLATAIISFIMICLTLMFF